MAVAADSANSAGRDASEDHSRRVRSQFEQWDHSGNGRIGRGELRAMLSRLRPDFTQPELEAIMDAVDTDGTGYVDYQAFVSWAFSGQVPPSNNSSCRSSLSHAGTQHTACLHGGHSPAGREDDLESSPVPDRRASSSSSSSSCANPCQPSKVSENIVVDLSAGAGVGGDCCAHSDSASSRSSSSSPSPSRQVSYDTRSDAAQVSTSSVLADALRIQVPRHGADADPLSPLALLPPLRLSRQMLRRPSSSASGMCSAPLRGSVRLSPHPSNRSIAESVTFPVQGSNLGASRSSGPLRGPHDGSRRPVSTAALRQAMDRLQQRVGNGEAMMTDRLLRQLTSTTVLSESGSADVKQQDEAESVLAMGVASIAEESVVEFGQDMAGDPRQTEVGTCGICFEEGVEVLSLCRRHSCSDRFCVSCSRRHAETLVNDALYAMPWLKCPGCAHRVDTQVWSGWVEESVLKRYLGNAEALMTFRCPSCHETGSLFCKSPSECKTNLQELLKDFGDATCNTSIRELWARYSSAMISAEDFISLLCTELLQGQSDAAPSQADPKAASGTSEVEGAPPEHLRTLMRPTGLPCMVSDAERRCSMTLAFLRRFPKIRTPCCSQPMCFKCKVSGWHLEETCEARQRREVDKDVQFCPGCGVPTVKSEGCDHIVCVCGESWSWAPNPVWNLVRTAQVDALEELFSQGFDVNYSDDETGESLLHVASESGNMGVLTFLLEHGADIERLDASGSTILAAAVRRPYRDHTLDVLNKLLEHRADVNASISPEGGFVITEALRTLAYGRATEEGEDDRDEAADKQRGIELIQQLLSARASVGVRDEDLDGATPLLEAIRGGFDDVASMLIAVQAAQPDVGVAPSPVEVAPRPQAVAPGEILQEHPPFPPLPPARNASASAWTIAPEDQDKEGESSPQAPLASCSSLEAADHSGNTPLYLAVSNRRHSVVTALLAARVAPNARGPSSTPPLHTAIFNQDGESFDLLLASRADANLTSEDGLLALHVALRALYRDHGSLDETSDDSSVLATCHRMVLQIIPQTLDLNGATQDGQTALGATAANGSLELMQALLEYRALPDRGARGGSAPLGLAAQCGQAEAVKLLLEHRANPARVDRGGQTAMHRLAGNWMWQDADPRRSDDQWLSCRGRKPLGRAQAACALINADADVNSLDIIGRTPLLLACDPPMQVSPSAEQQAVVDALLEMRSNVNLASSTGITPLVAATQKDVEVVVTRLLKYGVDTNSPEPLSGTRPLKIAIQRMHIGIVKALTGAGADVRVVDRTGHTAVVAWLESLAAAYKARRGPWAPKQRLFDDMLQAITHGRTQDAFAPCRGVPPLLAAWKQLDGLGQRAGIQMLLQARADANSTDSLGRTVLHSICGSVGSQRSSASMMELIQSVLHARGDAARESEDGDTPLDLAVNAGPGAHQVFKALLESLPECSLTAPRWSRILFRELAGDDESSITALIPRTGAAHFNDLGQGPLEAFLGQSVFHESPPWQAPPSEQPAAPAPTIDALTIDAEAQLRTAELLHRHGAVLPTPAWVWSKLWAAGRASQSLQRLEDLGEQGPKLLASLAASAGTVPPAAPLAGMLAAVCALVGMEPEPVPQVVPLPLASYPPAKCPKSPRSARPRSKSPAGSSFPAWVARFRPAIQQLLDAEGTMLLQRLACAAAPELGPPLPLSGQIVRELSRFLEDPVASGPEVLQKAGGAAAVQLGAWVRATLECLHVPKLAPVSLKAIVMRIESLFEDQPDMRQRWLRLVLTAVANVDAEDGAGGRATHLALRSRDLGVGDAFLPLLRRGANISHLDGTGTSVLDLLRERAWEALGSLPSPLDSGSSEANNVAQVGNKGPRQLAEGGSAVEALAEAIAEVEQCSLQLRLQEAAAQQCTVVEGIETRLREVAAQVDEKKQDIEAPLQKVLPKMEEALEALDRLEYEDLNRTRMLAQPPAAVALVFAAVCQVLGVGPGGKTMNAARQHAVQCGLIALPQVSSLARPPLPFTSEEAGPSSPTALWSYEACLQCWPASQKLLSVGLIIQQIHCFDKDRIPEATMARLRPLQAHVGLDPDGPLQDSATGAALALWLRALIAYHDAAASVAPMKEKFQELTKLLEAQEANLADELRCLQELQATAKDSGSGLRGTLLRQPPSGAVTSLPDKGRDVLATRGQAVREALQLSEESEGRLLLS